MDKVDGVRLETPGMLGGQGAVVLQVEENGIAVVGRQVELGQKIGAENTGLYIGYNKFEFKTRGTNLNGTGYATKTLNVRAISSL